MKSSAPSLHIPRFPAIVFLFFFPLSIAFTQAHAQPEAKVVTDCAGRQVMIPHTIKRIACLYAFTGHAVTLLGRGQDIVAVSNGLKRDSLLHRICPSILDAAVPKAQGAINIEELLKTKPDILFVSADIGTNGSEVSRLDAFTIPYMVVDFTTIQEEKKAVTVMGEALGETDKARAYVRYMDDSIEKVAQGIPAVSKKRRCRLYYSVNEANRTTLAKDLSTDWLDHTGVINVALEKAPTLFEGKNFVSLEQIYVWNPDIILANEPAARTRMITDANWANLNAVKNDKVFQMPIGVSRWGHPGSIETPLALLWTAKTLYPDQFEDLDMASETKRFYKIFFDYALTDLQVKQILSGKMLRKPKARTGKNNHKGQKP